VSVHIYRKIRCTLLLTFIVSPIVGAQTNLSYLYLFFTLRTIQHHDMFRPIITAIIGDSQLHIKGSKANYRAVLYEQWIRNFYKLVIKVKVYVKVKISRYRPGVAQRVGRGIALLFHDRSTRRGWVPSSTPRPHFTPGKDPVPILQEAGWAPGPVWTGG